MAGGAAVAVYNSSDNISKPLGEGLGEIAKTDPEIFVGAVKTPITIVSIIITCCILVAISPLLKLIYRSCERISKRKNHMSDKYEKEAEATPADCQS